MTIATLADIADAYTAGRSWHGFWRRGGPSMTTGLWTDMSYAAGIPVANYPTAGTAGKALSLASSGGVDLNALAAAVWQYAIENAMSAEQMMRVLLAALAGTSERTGNTITFTSPVDGSTIRIVGSFDAENNRTGAVLDGS